MPVKTTLKKVHAPIVEVLLEDEPTHNSKAESPIRVAKSGPRYGIGSLHDWDDLTYLEVHKSTLVEFAKAILSMMEEE